MSQKPGGTYGGVPLTHGQAETLRRLWREPGATAATVVAAFAAAVGRTVSHHTAYNHRPLEQAPPPQVRRTPGLRAPALRLSPDEESFLIDAWRRPGATNAIVADLFAATFGRRPSKETVARRRPTDVAPSAGVGRDRPTARTAAGKQALVAAYLGPPPPPTARVPVAAPGPLTPGQSEVLARLWALFPDLPARDIAARFAADTGRLIDAATAERNRPLPPLTADERADLERRGAGPADGVPDDEVEVIRRVGLIRRAVAQRAGFHRSPFPTPRGRRPTDPPRTDR